MPHTRLTPTNPYLPKRLAALQAAVPEAFADGTLNWDTLRALFDDDLDDGAAEHFGLTWPGKREAARLAARPSVGTLRPVPGQGIAEDTTRNLFIEGDNLEVLKALQKSYAGRVKLIYIDPPYNTGNDFIYPDDYTEPLEAYLRRTGQADTEGLLTSNPKSSGRYHSNWLNMMYPRLELARQLLRDDGVIFISIGNEECHHLRMILNEVFGENNFVSDIAVVNNLKGRNDKRYIAHANDRLLMYVKSESFEESGLSLPDVRMKEFDEVDSRGLYRRLGLRKRGGADTRVQRPNMYYPFYVCESDLTVSLTQSLTHTVKVVPLKSDGVEGCWRWGKETELDLI